MFRRNSIYRPRQFRLIFGSVLTITGLIVGVVSSVLVAKHLSIGDSALEITVDELVERGIPGQGLVELTGISFGKHPSCQPESPMTLVSLDPQHRVVMRVFGEHQENLAREAFRVGRVTAVAGNDVLRRGVVGLLGRFEVETTAMERLAGMPTADEYPIVVEPVDVASAHFERQGSLFQLACGGGILTTAMGLVLAGSSGPGFLTIPLIPFSLPGFPLRYGRGRASTRLFYLLASGVLFAAAYWLAVERQGFFQFNKDPMLAPAAFGLISLGMASLAGTVVNTLFQRSVGNLEDLKANTKALTKKEHASNQSQGQVLMTSTLLPDGVGLSNPVIRYNDPQVRVSLESTLPEPLMLPSTGFEALEFEGPLLIESGDGKRFELQTIQIGCQNMVLVVNTMSVDEDEGEKAHAQPRTRLYSVLESGQVVTSLSAGTPVTSNHRKCNSGMIVLQQSDDPRKLLAQHLDSTVELAESMASTICDFYPGEWRDVYAYVHKVEADIGHHFGDNHWKVFPAKHGRFEFPAQQVEPLESLDDAMRVAFG